MTINSKGLFFTDLLAAEPADAFAVNFRRTVSRELLKRCGELELTPGKLAKKANDTAEHPKQRAKWYQH